MPPDPTALQQASEAFLPELLKMTASLSVMWYMLRDLKTVTKDIGKKVTDLELKIASDHSQVHISNVKDNLTDFKDEYREDREQLLARIHDLEKQLPKVWAKIGDRPEDIAQRRGTRS